MDGDAIDLIRKHAGIKHNGCIVVSELGINHNGDVGLAKQLLTAAKAAGADVAKLQMGRGHWIPLEQRAVKREWQGQIMSYQEYRQKLELSDGDLNKVSYHCDALELPLAFSAFDTESMNMVKLFDPPFYKIPSCKMNDMALLECAQQEGKPVVVSTGMADMDEVLRMAAELTPADMLMHCVSCYPCEPRACNLRVMASLTAMTGRWVGYSGHERGYQVTLAAAIMGAPMVERHLTLDRTLLGTDQAASLEPHGFARMVRDIRICEQAQGDGVKRLLECELPSRKKLRGD